MTSVVSRRTFANSSSVAVVVFVDRQQDYRTKPLPIAISRIDRVLDNRRKVLDHSPRTGLPI
jgi:hypothetical protein